MIFDKSPSLSVRWIPFFLCLGDDEKINQRHQLCWNSILHVSLIPEHSSLFLLHTIPFLNQGTKFTLWSLVFHITDNGMWIVLSFSYRYITKSVVNFLFFSPFCLASCSSTMAFSFSYIFQYMFNLLFNSWCKLV